MNDTFQINQIEYIYPDITPKIPKINIENLKQIEQKIKDYFSGNKEIGLNREELEQFLDWVTFNSRSYAVRNIHLPTEIAISTEPLSDQCAPTQNINVKISKKLGIHIYPFNIEECINKITIPKIPLDIKSSKRMFLKSHSTCCRSYFASYSNAIW